MELEEGEDGRGQFATVCPPTVDRDRRLCSSM